MCFSGILMIALSLLALTSLLNLILQLDFSWLKNPEPYSCKLHRLVSSLWLCNCCRFILKMDGLTSHTQFPKVRLLYLFIPGGSHRCGLRTTLMFPQRLPVSILLLFLILCRFILMSDFAQPRLELRLAEQV